MSSIGSPKNVAAALLLDGEQRPLNRADRRGRDVAVLGRELLRVVADELQHRPQVAQVEQQQPVVVGNLEDEREHAALGLVEIEEPAEQRAAPCRTSSREPDARLAEHVPERDRTRAPTPARISFRASSTLAHLRRQRTRRRQDPPDRP